MHILAWTIIVCFAVALIYGFVDMIVEIREFIPPGFIIAFLILLGLFYWAVGVVNV